MPEQLRQRTRTTVRSATDGLPSFVDIFRNVDSGGKYDEVGAALDRMKESLNPVATEQGQRKVTVVVSGGSDGNGGGSSGNGNGRDEDNPIVWKDFGIGTNETLQVGSAVYWDTTRVCYKASAADATKSCVGVVYAVRNTNYGQRVDVCVAGPCKALVTNMTGSDARLRLSTEAGKFTNNPDENSAVKVINQEVGAFLRYAVDAMGNTQTGLADCVFTYSPPVSAGMV